MLHEIAFFLKQALRAPGDIGAVLPSGRALGELVAQGLGPASGLVVEIGPGTGSLTRGLLAAGVPEENLVLVELNGAFCDHLSERFPKARVINTAAQEIPAFEIRDISNIISGLPLLNFPAGMQLEIVAAVFEALTPNGRLVQFTYGSRPPITPEVLQKLNLGWSRRGKVWANIPPANVYEFYRNPSH